MAVRPGRKPGLWVVEFEQDGRRVHKRLPAGVTKKDAERYQAALKREIFLREKLGDKPDLTLPKAIELWLSENRRKNQKQALSEAKQWADWAHGKLLRQAPEVAQEALRAWLIRGTDGDAGRSRLQSNSPRTSAVKPSTLNRRLALLKAVCKHAYKQGLIDDNLSGRIALLREDNKKEIYLTKAEVSRLAGCASSATITAAISILAYSGLRASELLALTAHTSRSATFVVQQSKTGKPRQVPIAAHIQPYLSALPLGLDYWQLQKGFSAARKKAKLPPTVTLHTLRHTCASWLIQSGVDLYTVGRILGHSSTQTTARYAHLSDDSLKAAIRKLK